MRRNTSTFPKLSLLFAVVQLFTIKSKDMTFLFLQTCLEKNQIIFAVQFFSDIFRHVCATGIEAVMALT